MDVNFKGRVAQITVTIGDLIIDETGNTAPTVFFMGIMTDPAPSPDLPPSQRQMPDWEAKALVAKALMMCFSPEKEELDKHPKLMIAQGGIEPA